MKKLMNAGRNGHRKMTRMHNAYGISDLLAVRRDLRIEDYRERIDRLENAIKQEKLDELQQKQHEPVVSASKVDVYV
jgi:hypothetical protein